MTLILTISLRRISWRRVAVLLKIALFPFLGSLVVACSARLPTPRANQPLRQSLAIRIGTYNVFTGTHDIAKTVKVIRSMNADVVALQELSPKGSMLLDRVLKQDYPYRRFSDGLAILSRYPLRNSRYQHSQRGINGFLIAEVDSPVGRFQIARLHLDPLHLWTSWDKWSLLQQVLWGQGKIHLAEVKQISEALKPGLPTILAGDFNSASHAALDQLRTQGFTDSFAEVTPHPDQTSTLHFKLLGIATGRRIDYILHDASFKSLESQTIPGLPSDHDPVVSGLSWKH
ncbi:MAG: hypothetical protein CFE26_01890 [Verrucomicrobiales bacterium VVV1]|nr:MAG: hypothetical protein CFE26_01890 [Verrucomicrobiales bacterium VVV1]